MIIIESKEEEIKKITLSIKGSHILKKQNVKRGVGYGSCQNFGGTLEGFVWFEALKGHAKNIEAFSKHRSSGSRISISQFVYICVCVWGFTFEVLKRLFDPTSRCKMSKNFRDLSYFGKVMERSGVRFCS